MPLQTDFLICLGITWHCIDDLVNYSLPLYPYRFILDHCPRLSHLSLAGCHGLPWDLRREYQRDMLGDLRENLAVWAEEEVH